MDTILIVLVVVAVLLLLFIFFMQSIKKKRVVVQPLPAIAKKILQEQVIFYQPLSPVDKQAFENRMQHFLATTAITGINTTVEELDRVLIAASAIIPIFYYSDWEYINLNEVLLYPDSFNHDFEQKGGDRTILGMVGDGAMSGVMILSQHELRQGFINKTGKENTAIHEFVHLVDKTDGSVDGIPEVIMQQQYVVPWLQLMQREIKKILDDKSDINPYGATNEAEFFAVVAEYFFERPALLAEKHPVLYDLLCNIFKRQQ